MKKTDLSKDLQGPAKAEVLAEKIKSDPKLLPSVIEGISAANATARFKSAKILRILSENIPERVYQHMDFFISLMDDKNNILKWNALDVIANLTGVDRENRFDAIFDKYFSLLSDESMVTAAHVVDNSWKIVKNKPSLEKKITNVLLRLEKRPREEECKNILLGKAILSFDQYWNLISDKKQVLSFVKKQMANRRNSTKKKAERFLSQ